MAGAMRSAAVLGRGVLGVPAYASTASGTMSGDPSVPQTPALRKCVDPLPLPMTAISDPSVYPGADYHGFTRPPAPSPATPDPV